MTQTDSNQTAGGTFPGAERYRLKVSRYDRVAGALLALLTAAGLAVAIMLVLWLSGRLGTNLTAHKIDLLPNERNEKPLGTEHDIALAVPEQPELIQEENTKILNAVAIREVRLHRPGLDEKGVGDIDGDDSRTRGGGPAMIVRFAKGLTVEEYARQLDFFGIELGVREGETVHYASNLSRPQPTTRVGTVKDESKQKRLMLVASSRDELAATDRELARKAGITTKGSVFKFLPGKWASQLRQLLKNAAGDRKVRFIRYLIVPDGKGGYAFEVIGQPTFR
ncbi:MAG: hypothetical protein JW818_14175 [Pirellulales bacterium]|nr:hypothetical protein [Pirellulales bacterium]